MLQHHKRIHTSTPSNLQQQPQQIVVQTPTTVTVATTPERPYTCDVCGACFALPGELKSHKTNMHQKPKVQICEDCGSEDPCEHHPTKVKKSMSINFSYNQCQSHGDIDFSINAKKYNLTALKIFKIFTLKII